MCYRDDLSTVVFGVHIAYTKKRCSLIINTYTYGIFYDVHRGVHGRVDFSLSAEIFCYRSCPYKRLRFSMASGSRM